MLMEKIRRGVLQVATDSGVRYVEPSLSERLQLLWTFRNFTVLSEEILSQHERELVSHLCAVERLRRLKEMPACVIGTVELPVAPQLKRPPRSVMAMQARSSA